MKKIFPILIIIIVIMVVLFFVYSKFGKSLTRTSQNADNEQANDTSQQVDNKSYTFKALKEAINLGIPLKCTYKAGDSTFEGYLKGRQWRGKIVTDQGNKGEIILKDECMWTWSEQDTQGITMCFEPGEDGKSVWDIDENAQNSSVAYNCIPEAISDDMFNPPSNIEFVDIKNLTGGQEIPVEMQE